MLTLCLTSAAALMSARQPTTAIPGILVTRQLMEARGLRVGDVVQAVPRVVRRRRARVPNRWRIEPTPDPLRFAQPKFEVRMHLPDLSSLVADPSDPGSLETVTAINVALTQPADAAPFARELAARLPGAVARPTSAPDDRTSTFVVLERFHLAIAIVTVVGSAVFLLALMVMLVEERRATVGILRLIGFTRQRILLQVFAEGAVIAVAGAVAGVLFARLHPRGSSTGSSSGATTRRWSSCGSRRAWRCSRWPWRFHWAYWPASSRRGRSCGSSC